MIKSPLQLAADLSDAVNDSNIDHVMINVAGRWTGVKKVTVDEINDIIFIETQD